MDWRADKSVVGAVNRPLHTICTWVDQSAPTGYSFKRVLTVMTRETGRRQPNKEQAGTRRASLSMRSPALESAEKRRANLPPEPRQRRIAPGRVQGGGSRRNVRYAAEESLYRPAIARSRKRLPGTRVPLG